MYKPEDFENLCVELANLESEQLLFTSEKFTPEQIHVLEANQSIVTIRAQCNTNDDFFYCIARVEDTQFALDHIHQMIREMGGSNIMTQRVS